MSDYNDMTATELAEAVAGIINAETSDIIKVSRELLTALVDAVMEEAHERYHAGIERNLLS